SALPLALQPFPTRRSSDLGQLAFQPDLVPHGQPPVDALGGFLRDFGAWRVFDDEHVVGVVVGGGGDVGVVKVRRVLEAEEQAHVDRKSTRLNSSHEWISYA